MPWKKDSETGIEQRLIENIYSTGFDDLGRDVIESCKRLIVDSLGVTFPGATAPGCQNVLDIVTPWACEPGSSLLIMGGKVPPPMAALANSTMMHALDFDDTLDETALHTFVSVLPSSLAVSEAVGGIDGGSLIASIVIGVDIICRVSLAIRRPLSWIRSSTCGCFGAAAAAGKLMNLDREGLTNALGIAYSQTSGNCQGLLEGRLIKRMQPGLASQAGVMSAFLARGGITGSHKFLEGPYGYYNLYEQGEYDFLPVIEGLGEHFGVTDLSIKPYPCCRMTHSSIDAALKLREFVKGKEEKIESVEVRASKMVAEMVGKPFVIGTNPQVDAQFSIPYTVSTALSRGDVFLEDFEERVITGEKIRSLAEKVFVFKDNDLPAKDILRADMKINMKDGESFDVSVEAPRGNPIKPLSMEQCHDKFRKCLEYSKIEIGEDRVDELLDIIDNLEQIKDVGVISELMKR